MPLRSRSRNIALQRHGDKLLAQIIDEVRVPVTPRELVGELGSVVEVGVSAVIILSAAFMHKIRDAHVNF